MGKGCGGSGLNGDGAGINGVGGFQQLEAGDIARCRFNINAYRTKDKEQVSYTTPVKTGSKIKERG